MNFTEKQIAAARTHLLGDGSDDLIQYMKCRSLSWDVSEFGADVASKAETLGWIGGPEAALTEAGYCAADSCREYQFWRERDKALPFEGAAPHLIRPYFKDRSVIEIGSGMGANLLSLAGVAAETCGVEPIAGYRQLGDIFSEREGVKPPDVRGGAAEELPFADASADLVLCVSAHQYFEICEALPEITRTLRPGGELIIVGGTLAGFIKNDIRETVPRPGGAKAFGITIANTLSYMAMRKRIVPARQKRSTARPIYPSRAAMMRWMGECGLIEASPLTRIGWESCFHMRKQT